MPDHYAKLTRAVVEIGTQLRRLADAQTTAVADTTDAPTTSDDTRHATIAAALTAEHYRRAEAGIVASPEEHCAAMAHAVMRVMSPVDTTADAPTTTADDAPNLRQLIADALENADYRPDMRRGDLADAVLPVIMSIGNTLRGLHHSAEEDATEWAQRAVTAAEERDQLAATLHDVLSHFVHKGHPGQPCLSSGWVAEKTVAQWRAVLYPPATEEQHGSGGN